MQTVNIRVEKGYQPSRIILQAGVPVRLNFQRTDSNNCLAEVLLPDLCIKADLPLNQTIESAVYSRISWGILILLVA